MKVTASGPTPFSRFDQEDSSTIVSEDPIGEESRFGTFENQSSSTSDSCGNRMKKADFQKASARLEIDANLLGPCGFYCGACSAYRKGDCLGCRYQADRTCDILVCATEKGFTLCADCPKHLCDKFDFLKKMRKMKPSPRKRP